MSERRVLVWGLSNNRAGTEAVIYNYVTHIPNVSFDFLCYEDPLSFADLFDGTGNRYFTIPVKIQHPIKNWIALRRFMKRHAEEYEAVWINLNDLSNIDILVRSYREGIPRRIIHFHNSGLPSALITRFFSRLNWKTCLKLLTDRWACSKAAGDYLYGELPYRIIPNAVDAAGRVFDIEKRERVRKQWGLEDAFLIGTVGRIVEQKNQRLLIEAMPQLIKERANVALMIVGEGELHDELESLSVKMGVQDRVFFAGAQEDVQAYLSAFDVYAFPSLYEGLSLSLLEAQFNGLPCVISDGVSSETVISRNVVVEPLASNMMGWCKSLAAASRKDRSLIEEKARQYTFSHIREAAAALF